MTNSIFMGVAIGILLFSLSDSLKWLWGIIGIKIPKVDGMNELRQASSIFLLADVGILSPFLEEVLFRFIPLSLVMLFGNDYLTWSVVILASVVFGFCHGSWKHVLNIGAVGIVLSWLFINFGFTSCLAAHITNNFFCSCQIILKRNSQPSPRLS